MAHTISDTLSVEGRIHGTHNQWHIVCGRFAKFAVYHHLLATISQHWQNFQANAFAISTITRSKPKIRHNGITDHRYRTRTNCMDAVMRMRNLANQKVERSSQDTDTFL